MATYGEIAYMVLDLLKERSDDAYYNEDHVLFLASNIRNYLLERKYSKSRNKSFQAVSDENKQRICLNLEQVEEIPGLCGPQWLRSTVKIPDTLLDEPKVSVVNDLLHSMIQFVPPERMPYIGYNKWLHNIIYASKSEDGYLYMKSNNPQYIHLQKIILDGVFSDAKEAAALSCDGNGNAVNCDLVDMNFPLETALVPSCVEMVVQELIGSRYAPEDKQNNARDDFGNIADTSNRTGQPVERQERTRQPEQEEQ